MEQKEGNNMEMGGKGKKQVSAKYVSVSDFYVSYLNIL